MLCFLTHHKCASTSLQIYLMQLARENGLQWFASHVGNTSVPLEYDICCLSNANYLIIKESVRPPALHIIRNPLNIVQSAYYSHRNTHDLNGWSQLQAQRQLLLTLNRSDGMLSTAKFCNNIEFYPGTSGPIWAIRHWNYDDSRIITLRVEDFINSISDKLIYYFGDILSEIKIPSQIDYQFSNFSQGRPAGVIDDNSHYRSGASDAWTRELPRETILYIVEQCQEVLERFYPESLAWIAENV